MNRKQRLINEIAFRVAERLLNEKLSLNMEMGSWISQVELIKEVILDHQNKIVRGADIQRTIESVDELVYEARQTAPVSVRIALTKITAQAIEVNAKRITETEYCRNVLAIVNDELLNNTLDKRLSSSKSLVQKSAAETVFERLKTDIETISKRAIREFEQIDPSDVSVDLLISTNDFKERKITLFKWCMQLQLNNKEHSDLHNLSISILEDVMKQWGERLKELRQSGNTDRKTFQILTDHKVLDAQNNSDIDAWINRVEELLNTGRY